jgi:hypothetical protein
VHTSRRPNLVQATVRNTNGLIPSQQIFCFWGRVDDANHPTRQAQSSRQRFGVFFSVRTSLWTSRVAGAQWAHTVSDLSACAKGSMQMHMSHVRG